MADISEETKAQMYNSIAKIEKEKLLNEIGTTLGRNDITQKDFVILHSLDYLLRYGYFPLKEVEKK